jgi:hypothetical protein
MKNKIRIGCGAGFSGDRIEPAVILAQKGELDYLILECLAERTIALAQKRKMADSTKGYDPFLERRMEVLLPHLVKNKIRLITNMGAANPNEGAKKVIEIAQKLGINVKVAAVSGDDIFDGLKSENESISIFGIENFALDLIGKHNSAQVKSESPIISANAYIGVEGILEALEADAQIIITGRVADPSLFLAPMIYELGWGINDYDMLGKGTVIGHLLECAGHITGGYFADPIMKPVENMENLGHPVADVFANGTAIISKVEGTGGIINLQTVKEQLLYEVINPNEYYTPDVIADFTKVKLEEIDFNKVSVSGGCGLSKPKTLKVSIGYKAFWLGEGEISYAGPAAIERAQLAAEIIKKRCRLIAAGGVFEEIKVDFIGLNSIFKHEIYTEINTQPSEIRLRVAAKAQSQADAALVGEEIEALYTNGPAGGGGVRKYISKVIGIASVLIDRNQVQPIVKIFES